MELQIIIKTTIMDNQEVPKRPEVMATEQAEPKTKAVAQPKESQMDGDQSSQWSLDSLEDIKGINIHQLEQQQNHHESRHREKPLLQAKFPEKPTFMITAPLHEIGKVIFVVGELLIVEANNGSFVVDLDNWVADEGKNLVGFVIDVLGKIDTPFYAIKPEVVPEVNSWLGKRLYYIEGTSKILKDEDIKSMQSKSAAEALQDIDDSSDEEIQHAPQRKYSEERREKKREAAFRRNQHWREDEMREESRERTRQRQHHNRHNSRSRNDHNQKYLQNMYNMHYNQMMRLYNGSYNPNPTPNFFPTMPTPPPNFNHANVAHFGSSHIPQPHFYGQNIQPTQNQGINFQANQKQGINFQGSQNQGISFPGTQSWSGQKPQEQWQGQPGPRRQ